MVVESAITSKGQATIPKAVRDRLGLGARDRVRFFFQPDGSVALLPVVPVSALRGMLVAVGRTVTLEAMDDAVADGAGERFAAKKPG
jgi:AbrB family looped-hinge helix DNA binding protein